MSIIQHLTQNGRLWTGHDWRQTQQDATPSGYRTLDAELPGGGWPVGAVTEIIYSQTGQGELRLLLPALARLSRGDSRWQVWFNPPFQPYAPGLAHWGLSLERLLICRTKATDDLLWSLEQCLSTGGSQALVAWVDTLDKARMRRLQLAAEKGRIPIFLLRSLRFQNAPSVAALRLSMTCTRPGQGQVDIIKRRAGWPVQNIQVPLPLFATTEAGDG